MMSKLISILFSDLGKWRLYKRFVGEQWSSSIHPIGHEFTSIMSYIWDDWFQSQNAI